VAIAPTPGSVRRARCHAGKLSQGITSRRDGVTGRLKYGQYVGTPEALQLRHPVNAYRARIRSTSFHFNPVNNYPRRY
jgi:hypothetical protein